MKCLTASFVSHSIASTRGSVEPRRHHQICLREKSLKKYYIIFEKLQFLLLYLFGIDYGCFPHINIIIGQTVLHLPVLFIILVSLQQQMLQDGTKNMPLNLLPCNILYAQLKTCIICYHVYMLADKECFKTSLITPICRINKSLTLSPPCRIFKSGKSV